MKKQPIEVLKVIISWTHIFTAALSLIFGAIILFGKKGNAAHMKYGTRYFQLMLASNITALLMYNTGKFFYPHWLAIITIAVILPGFSVVKLKRFNYWLQAHIVCMVASYYLLVGGAINEMFLHLESLQPFLHAQSPVYGLSHFFTLFCFIGIAIFFVIRYRKFNLKT